MRVLDKKDTFSFILSAIYAAQADPNYTVLADLIYMLDEKEFKRFMGLFEGQTIKIPTIKELNDMLGALMLYSYVDIEGMDIRKAMKELGYCLESDNRGKGPSEYLRLKQLIKEQKVNVGGVLDGFPSKSLQSFTKNY